MERVISPDGTSLSCYCSGTGSPLILVAGTGAANPVAWTGVIPELEERFHVYALDRRGHGASGDGPSYSLEREIEDIAAVADSCGSPASLLGHSFGALCALEATLLTRNIHKLILYEPAFPIPGMTIYPDGVIDRLQELLDAGEQEAALTTFYQEVVMLSSQEIEQLRLSPAWSGRVASAHTIPREARAEEQYKFDAQQFKDLQTPVLLLLGGDTLPLLKATTESIHAALPNSRIAVMPGQQHTAMYTAPEVFLHHVLSFLE